MKAPKHKQPSGHEALAPYSLGSKLKALRAEKGLTLARLGDETGLSTALLSKLESERMIPTLPTIAKISRAYGVDLGYFFSTVAHHSLSITRGAHIADPRREQPTTRNTLLHHVVPASRQFSKIVDIPAGATLNVGGAALRTELTAYVLAGPLSITVAGTVDVLQTGDCIVFDTDAAIIFAALENPCRLLTVFARSDRDHSRAATYV
jgi:transcriptional regulator with XRE-family HTH domain